MDTKLAGGFIKCVMGDNTMGNMLFPASGEALQIIGIHKLRTKTVDGEDRYCLFVSDGVQFCSSITGPELLHLVRENTLQKFSIIEVSKLVCLSVLGNKKIMGILELNQLASGKDVGGMIGNPIHCDETVSIVEADAVCAQLSSIELN